ncbi:transposase [Actinomadura madurae]|uniref:transposase n=1 Tax=Actinomadura madurae TaxID=1993 RepID=UPI0035565C7E
MSNTARTTSGKASPRRSRRDQRRTPPCSSTAAKAVGDPARPRRPGRPSKRTRRQLIDGIRRRVRTGAPGRDVPDCHGSWQAVYGPFRRRQRGGAPQRSAVAGTRPRAAVRSFPG